MMMFSEVLSLSRFSRVLLVVAGFSGVLSAVRAELPVVEGTMPEDYLPGLKTILQAAMKQSPQMVLSEIAVVQAEANRITADAQFYPNLGGTVQYTNGRSGTEGGASVRDQGLLYNTGFSQNIFHWGALKNQAEIARIGVAISKKNHREAFRLLANTLRAQYLALIVKKTSLVTAAFRQKAYEAALAVAAEQLRTGVISPAEYIGPELSLEDAKVAVARAELDFANSRRLLAHLAGLNDIDEGAIPSEVAKLRFSGETAVSIIAMLKRDNAEMTEAAQIAALNVKAADLSYRNAQKRLLPKIYANAGATQQNSTAVLPGTPGHRHNAGRAEDGFDLHRELSVREHHRILDFFRWIRDVGRQNDCPREQALLRAPASKPNYADPRHRRAHGELTRNFGACTRTDGKAGAIG